MPKGHDNVTLILDAARELFLEKGFDATSTDLVARQAGVSKATLYANFASKQDLLARVITREGQQPIATLDAAGDAREVLHAFALQASALLLSPTNSNLSRLIASTVSRTPEIGRLFYDNGPDRLLQHLARYLKHATSHGELAIPSPRLAASQFLAIIVGDLQLRATLALHPPRPAERRRVAKAGVEVFLAAYRVR